ncbi:MAG: hypothetical protein IT379_37420, partial [Deltaproteobacteria bacterium]|nr:hypothetical protein [Deltaproteobacteria bacterium]
EMGEWDLARAVPLEHVHASGWATTIAFDDAVGYDVHYKFALRRRGRWHREVGPGHRRRVPASPPAMVGAPAGCVSAIWHDSWRG